MSCIVDTTHLSPLNVFIRWNGLQTNTQDNARAAVCTLYTSHKLSITNDTDARKYRCRIKSSCLPSAIHLQFFLFQGTKENFFSIPFFYGSFCSSKTGFYSFHIFQCIICMRGMRNLVLNFIGRWMEKHTHDTVK